MGTKNIKDNSVRLLCKMFTQELDQRLAYTINETCDSRNTMPTHRSHGMSMLVFPSNLTILARSQSELQGTL